MATKPPGTADLSIDEGAEKRRDPTKDFALIEKLGEGSYGSVWKSNHIKTGTITAIKRVPVENDLDEILNEIKIMKGCRSPYIISYYGSYFKENELWIVMEYCGAGSVSDLMKITDKFLTEDQISAVVKDSLKGLVYLHSMRKIHRDIKAGNILLNDKGESKLADFGVSGQLSDTMAKRQTVIGTPFWMAPEVIQEVGYDVKADLWSLGITCIEMAEGKPPYSNIHPMRAIFMIPSRPPPKLTEPETWSKEFNDFISKCLTKNPEQRPVATELLKHPFVGKAKPTSVLLPLIEESAEIVNRIGREEAMGMVENSDEEDEEENNNNNANNGSGDGTAKVKRNVSNSETANYGTMVVADDEETNSGTMKVGTTKVNDANYVPPFMAHIKQQQQQQQQQASPQTPSKDQSFGLHPKESPEGPKRNPKYANTSTEELRKMLADLDAKMEKEVEATKAKYALKRKDLETIIQRKKQEAMKKK